MPKKPKRDPMVPVLEVKTGDSTFRLYAVDPGEVWKKDRFVFRPTKSSSLIYEAQYPSNYCVSEEHVWDANTWKWLQDFADKGMAYLRLTEGGKNA